MSALTVWHLSSNRWNSAITEYALSAARALMLAGHRSVFTPLAGSPAEARAERYLETRAVPRFTVAELGKLRTMAREIRPDVIMTYGGPETFLSKALPGAVVRFRGQALDAGGFASGARQRFAHAHAALLLAPSEALAAQLTALAPEQAAVCVPLGCDTQVFTRVPAASLGERPELVVLGRLDPVKGHAAMMRLMVRVLGDWPGDLPRPRLHVVGEPANLSATYLTELVKAAGLTFGDDFRLTATRVPDIARLLSEATLGVVPSLGSEIICRVAEEFLLCGTPVVVSGVGSLDEVLFSDAGGSYRGLGDEEAAALLGAWTRQSLAEGEAAKVARAAQARALFSLESMGAALSRLIEPFSRW